MTGFVADELGSDIRTARLYERCQVLSLDNKEHEGFTGVAPNRKECLGFDENEQIKSSFLSTM
jgi:hypothetical protein